MLVLHTITAYWAAYNVECSPANQQNSVVLITPSNNHWMMNAMFKAGGLDLHREQKEINWKTFLNDDYACSG